VQQQAGAVIRLRQTKRAPDFETRKFKREKRFRQTVSQIINRWILSLLFPSRLNKVTHL
jgi:hypothetical protein